MSEAKLVNFLKHRREQTGWSQTALAAEVGVSRQALIAIEAGRQVPSTGLSLQLARTLGCRVDDLFQLAPAAGLEAVRVSPADAGTGPWPQGGRVVIGCLDGSFVAHPLADDACTAADGVVRQGRRPDRCLVDPLTDTADLRRNVLVAGCAPLLGLAAQRASLRYRDARITWLPAGSQRALDLLTAGCVHVAGVHFMDGSSEETDRPTLRKRFPGQRMLVVNLTRWRQGLVVAKGNPLAIRRADDLLRPGIRFAWREQGAAAYLLARRCLTAAGLQDAPRPRGPTCDGHHAVAQFVARGAAEVGVAIEGAALAAGLDFIPLTEERFDLVLPAERATEPPVSRLLDLLSDAAFRLEVAHLPGYDDTLCGTTTTLDPPPNPPRPFG